MVRRNNHGKLIHLTPAINGSSNLALLQRCVADDSRDRSVKEPLGMLAMEYIPLNSVDRLSCSFVGTSVHKGSLSWSSASPSKGLTAVLYADTRAGCVPHAGPSGLYSGALAMRCDVHIGDG